MRVSVAGRTGRRMTEATWFFTCRACRSQTAFGPEIFGCPECRKRGAIGLLELQQRIVEAPASLASRGGRGLARYLDLLPTPDTGAFLSLGEGGTALVPSRSIGPRLGLKLYFKLEHQNPTLSFKDRFSFVSINVARAFGFSRVAVSSTGNLALSTAAYAAAAGLRCLIIVPAGTPAGILDEAQLYGADIFVVDREVRLAALDWLRRYPQWFPIGLFLRRSVQNPFGVEGYKTLAYETVEALGEAPAAMLFPAARGNGLYGAWKGYLEARRWGWTQDLPRMVACQPEGADSLRASLLVEADTAVELPPIDSIAKSVSETVAGDEALEAIRCSHGTALAVGDTAIREAITDLGREGLNVEASSAVPVACLPQLQAALPDLDTRRPIVLVLTASGLRWPGQVQGGRNLVRTVDSLEEFDGVLREMSG